MFINSTRPVMQTGKAFAVSWKLSSSLFVKVISPLSLSIIFNRIDVKEGVNCTNLLNVFLEVVNPLNFGVCYPSWFKPGV